MYSSVVALIGLIVIGFIVYMAFRDRLFSEGYEPNPHPAIAPLEVRTEPVAPPRTVAPSGPSAPSQAAPSDEVVVYGDPSARDPYADKQERANAPEKMRYPERSYRPAVENTDISLAGQAGIAGEPAQNSPQAYQKFQTEFIQNSGEFMNGVYANDTTSPTNFSAF